MLSFLAVKTLITRLPPPTPSFLSRAFLGLLQPQNNPETRGSGGQNSESRTPARHPQASLCQGTLIGLLQPSNSPETRGSDDFELLAVNLRKTRLAHALSRALLEASPFQSTPIRLLSSLKASQKHAEVVILRFQPQSNPDTVNPNLSVCWRRPFQY